MCAIAAFVNHFVFNCDWRMLLKLPILMLGYLEAHTNKLNTFLKNIVIYRPVTITKFTGR